ncbi:hypothetical protein NLU13_7027 [Sarocladium strictum]|uniref:Uncharacterized protein n=1 Tax=Sarocladium strictum TaxID=5046 RepID=A0AA39L6K1_SARSR|nr:hypothetical protein NLU13_7027 [Sarocladium strictum]
MSSSRGNGTGWHENNRPRSRSGLDDNPPWPRLPPMRALPPLRGISTLRDHDEESQAPPPPPPPMRHQRIPYMSTNAAIRAERIRSLQNPDERVQSMSQDLPGRTSGWTAFHRGNDSFRNGSGNSPDEIAHSIDDLDEANSRLRALLDLTNNPLRPPHGSTHDPVTLDPSTMRVTFSPSVFRPNELPEDSNRRNKRRKLDAEKQSHNFKGFRYGKYGQLEPGQLQMEIVSCDGGMFSNRAAYSAENILKDDNSVYCTKGNRCNIILRHQGATAFTLQELVIKAPASMNFSHPVREGMVFITMEQDDALNRTARYQVQYNRDTTTQSPATCPYANNNTSTTDPSDDFPFAHAFDREVRRVITIRHRADGSVTSFPWPILDSDDDSGPTNDHHQSRWEARRRELRSRMSGNNASSSDPHHRRHPSMPVEFSANHPDFHITTECSDDEDDPASASSSSYRPRPPPNRIGSLPFETEPESDTDPSLLLTASNPSLLQACEAHTLATQEAVRAVGGTTLLSPHARFFIEKRKSKCTIRFDPPVSGRFILLKMWSSNQDVGGNIDIQSVIARGFAGPRYFPSVELR